MNDTDTPLAPYPPYPHPLSNRVKSILDCLDNPIPQELETTPQNASAEVLSEVTDKDPKTSLDGQSEVPLDRESLVDLLYSEDDKGTSDAGFEAEARRIARELVKLYHVGAISSADDPNAVFFACLIRDFGAVFIPQVEPVPVLRPGG